jgi:tetratricopeptide (TPR) repeat protein
MNKYFRHAFILISLMFITGFAGAQTLDSIRQTAKNKQYREARELCMDRDDYPENPEVLFLIGQAYFWEGNTVLAKEEFQKVINKNPRHIDAISALTSIDIAEEKYSQAIERSSEGLTIQDNYEDLLYFRARAYAEISRIKSARTDLDKLLNINPEHEEGLKLKESLNSFKFPGAIGLFQSVQWNNHPDSEKLYLTIAEAPIGDRSVKIVPRFSYGFFNTPLQNESGSQAGIAVYPLTGTLSYMYLHYAFSDSKLFPHHRAAAEWFNGINNGWEISAGARYINWNNHQVFMSVSGSKYIGQWVSGFRLFYSPTNTNDISAILSTRHYLREAKSYVQVYLSYGLNPDRHERQIDFSSTPNNHRLTGGGYTSLLLSGLFYIRFLAEYNLQEFQNDVWHNGFLLQTGIEYKF